MTGETMAFDRTDLGGSDWRCIVLNKRQDVMLGFAVLPVQLAGARSPFQSPEFRSFVRGALKGGVSRAPHNAQREGLNRVATP